MIDEEIGNFQGKPYRAVEFVKNSSGTSACDYCAFQLGKCRGAIWNLGQCSIWCRVSKDIELMNYLN